MAEIDKDRVSQAESTGSASKEAAARGTAAPRKSLRRFLFAALYILFLATVLLGTFAALEYYAYLKIKNSPIGQAYKGRSLDYARMSSQKVAAQFGYEPTPGFCAVRNTRLGNSYEYINDESFKDFEEVPLDKPADEFRIIVTGGSVVYGRGPVPPVDVVADFYEVTFRWTIPHIMEMLLNADPAVRAKIGNKKVRVINAGVPGHVIQNDFTRYLAKLRLFKPDLVVSLDGANEVHTVARPLKDWNYFTEGPYWEVVRDVMDLGKRGFVNYLTLWLKRNTYFFAWLSIRHGEGAGILDENRGFASHPQDPTPEMIEFRKRNIDQVADVEAFYHKVLETDGVPHVFALQPMLRNCKKKRSPMELKIEAATGMQKIGFYDAAETYDVLVDRVKKRGAEAGIEIVDLTDIFHPVTEWVWTDWCHLTNGANYIIARQLVYEIKKRCFNLPVPPNGPFDAPLDSYFQDYAKKSKVLVDGKATDSGLHILKGYPGQEVLDVSSEQQGQQPGVVLDMGAVAPVSRLRIVWADEKSVPGEWRADFSEDGKDWKTWLKQSETKTDPYDQWPGLEYYAASESPARYVRYEPTGGDKGKPIRLRQISLFR
ncbi:MAG: discoidin domain-containing protein [Desulfomonile tiedjei]|nr:discoidin domain-containing protein [Desulfomonile tiedjei]